MYAADWDPDAVGNYARAKAPTVDSQMTPVRVTLETTLAAPDKAAAVPVWTSPISLYRLVTNIASPLFQTVRVEVLGHDGAVLARRFVAASELTTQNWNSRRVIVVNSPEAAGDFQGAGLVSEQVSDLVPDAYAYGDVRAVWIDGSSSANTHAVRQLLAPAFARGHDDFRSSR